MTLKEFKTFLLKLPNEFDAFEIVNGELGKLSGDAEYLYRVDKPITTIYVDENNKEICMLHDVDTIEHGEDKVF